MKISDAVKTLQQSVGNHLDKIYIPSLKRSLLFKPLTTADVKTLTRISFLEDFDISVQMIKLSLFDKLSTEDLSNLELTDKDGNKYPPLQSTTLTQVDYLSFLCGIRQLLDNDVTYNLTCSNPECHHQWQYTLKVEQFFQKEFNNFERQTKFFQKIDQKSGHSWKFELTNFTMEQYLYFRYTMQKMKQRDQQSPEVMFEHKFVKPILYIKNIWLNGQIIQDWNTLVLPSKLNFFNKISPTVTINDSESTTLYDFIYQNFVEQKMEQKINNMVVECPECHRTYGGTFKFDDFFTF